MASTAWAVRSSSRCLSDIPRRITQRSSAATACFFDEQGYRYLDTPAELARCYGCIVHACVPWNSNVQNFNIGDNRVRARGVDHRDWLTVRLLCWQAVILARHAFLNPVQGTIDSAQTQHAACSHLSNCKPRFPLTRLRVVFQSLPQTGAAVSTRVAPSDRYNRLDSVAGNPDVPARPARTARRVQLR